MKSKFSIILSFFFILLSACQPVSAPGTVQVNLTTSSLPRVLATESFIADIAQNVAGNRLKVDTLVPIGMDPHSFEPTPLEVTKISDCDLLIVNGAGLETWLQKTLNNVGGNHRVVEASAGLTSRKSQAGESSTSTSQTQVIDPHFWMDPTKVITYVDNIRDALIQIDPAGKDIYTQNANSYTSQLNSLDQWVSDQVSQVASDRRLLVTNHESLGYFADRYGFKIVGAIIPNISPDASPSAQQLAALIDEINATHAPAIFLEAGANSQLADQVASETGVKVITDLYTETLTPSNGVAPTYLDMIKYNTGIIVNALK